MPSKLILSTLILGAAFASTGTIAGTATLYAKVNRTMLHSDGTFGGCMAQLSANPQAALSACAPFWVSFSCTGDFTDQVAAYRSFDQAQLALAANKDVMVVVDDSRRHNGYCFSSRIDVLR
jgi:hypothetical protein